MERKYFNPWADASIGLSRLPHWDQPGATYFVSFHLANSLPSSRLRQWREERAIWLKFNPEPWAPSEEREYHQRFSLAIEYWLDEGHGKRALRRGDLRSALAEVFSKFDRDRYWQHAWVLMPNHVHLLFSLKVGVSLAGLIKIWKGASARAIRLRLGSEPGVEAFWQKDYHDRLVRDEAHFHNCANYIRLNPEKARLRENEYTLYLSEEMRSLLDGKWTRQ